ncbi:adenosylcobinamide-phosphate synthase [Aliiruegeria haliotis]|uniref:Cobalamin biosynthesis protein CobD n=1 Tax=Aliiruegeria haliotis TaxID=1280846 RepID=A0A2T0RIX0_9RHOB|nr:adenosylcobinamide-phosphate synthase CbiB [Aliiruegeria haliotis]PRY21156.1 adenosylcobinamide-phosphate synthase [Aliiruegeria haliotis]
MIGKAAILMLAMFLDASLGEPRWLWSRLKHPAVAMGDIVGWLDRHLNRGTYRRSSGTFAVVVLAIGAALFGLLLQILTPFGLIDVLIVAILLAQRSLVQHVAAVASGLRQGLPEGRQAVSMIVGRDVAQLDEAGVARAAIESGAENLSDGVIAPAFWFLLAGLPGIFVYKAVNTADSMIGHRTPEYEDFGWAAARLDDLLNWIPARLTALLIMAGHGRFGGWTALAQDARKHRSPNAGWPEAAMARCLDVALSGPRSYDGEMHDCPHVHASGNMTPGAEDIDRCARALWRSWGVMLVAVALLTIL